LLVCGVGGQGGKGGWGEKRISGWFQPNEWAWAWAWAGHPQCTCIW
jgi:hypothetical protein